MGKIVSAEDWLRERKAKCRRCLFWDRIDSTSGYCRQGSPFVPEEGKGQNPKMVRWPITAPNDWSGSFQPRFPFGAKAAP